MKILFALLFLLKAQAAPLPAPEPNLFDTLVANATSSLDREQRFLLAAHFPKLFPIHILCQFRPAQGEPQVVAPGDWIDATGGGTVVCPDGVEATLAQNTKVQFRQMGSLPLFRVEQGSATIGFQETQLFLETSGLSLGVAGASRLQQLEVLKEADSETLRCNRGFTTASLELNSAPSKRLFESKRCRMDISFGSPPQTRSLFAGDAILAENLALARTVWPPPVRKGGPIEETLGVMLLIPPAQPAALPIKLQWNVSSEFSSLACELYSQAGDAAQPVPVKKITLTPGQGETIIEAPLSTQLLSMLCEDDKGLIASNVIVPRSSKP